MPESGAVDPGARIAVRGAAKIALASYLGNIAGALAGIVIPRALGSVNYGEYAFLSATFSIATGLSRLGLGLVITRQFTPLYHDGRMVEAEGLYRAYFLSRFASGVISSTAALIFLFFAGPFETPATAALFVSGLCMIWALTDALFFLQLGAQRYGHWAFVYPSRALARLILVPPGFYMAGLPGAFAALMVGEGALCVYGYIMGRKIFPADGVKADFRALRSHIHLALYNYGNQVLGIAGRYVGVLLVAFATQASDLTGFFALSLRLINFIFSAPLQTASSLTPALSILHEKGEYKKLESWLSLIARAGLMAFVVIWGNFALLGKPLLIWAVGGGFEPVYYILFILLLSSPFQWMNSTLYLACNVYKKPELTIPAETVWLVCYLALGVWWLNLRGPEGLAAAYSVAFLVSWLVTCQIVKRVLGLRIALLRSLMLVLCTGPFVAELYIGAGGFAERIALALTGTAMAVLTAHFIGALKIDELRSLYRMLRSGPEKAANLTVAEE